MKNEILIYGLPPNENKSYMEQLLSTQCKNQHDIDSTIELLKREKYHSFRIAYFNWEKPNFTKTVNI